MLIPRQGSIQRNSSILRTRFRTFRTIASKHHLPNPRLPLQKLRGLGSCWSFFHNRAFLVISGFSHSRRSQVSSITHFSRALIDTRIESSIEPSCRTPLPSPPANPNTPVVLVTNPIKIKSIHLRTRSLYIPLLDSYTNPPYRTRRTTLNLSRSLPTRIRQEHFQVLFYLSYSLLIG